MLDNDNYISFNKINQTNFQYTIDTASTREILLFFQIDHYLYSTNEIFKVIKLEYDSLFNPVTQCQFLYNNQYEIDLSLSISTSIDENDITPFLYNSKGEDVIINKVGDTNIYKLDNIQYGEYTLMLFYMKNTIPFNIKTFNVTSFDQTRNAFNLNSTEFVIDFRDIICDIQINQLIISDTLLNVLLNCEYTLNRLICKLSNDNELPSLTIGEHSLYKTNNEWFFDISLLGCVKPNDRVDSVTRNCLSTCKGNGDREFEYKEECVHECPLGSNVFNGFCMEDVLIVAQEGDSM